MTKLERNQSKDREDVFYLAKAVPFNFEILKARYAELRAQLMGIKENFDANFELWLEMIREARERK